MVRLRLTYPTLDIPRPLLSAQACGGCFDETAYHSITILGISTSKITRSNSVEHACRIDYSDSSVRSRACGGMKGMSLKTSSPRQKGSCHICGEWLLGRTPRDDLIDDKIAIEISAR